MRKADFSKNSNENKTLEACYRRLTRRDYSEKELELSLGRWHTPEAIQFAIAKVKSLGYLKEPEVLASMWAKSLRRKGRGKIRVNAELRKRGLPAVSSDRDEELQLCQQVYRKKFGQTRLSSQSEKAKAMRYLTSRGFDSETIRKVIFHVDSFDESQLD